MIYTHVTAAQRASKNKLIELFCDLRRANGWQIERIDTKVKGNRDRSEAERMLWNEHAKGLFEAAVLDDMDYLDLCIRRTSGDPLSLADRLCYERNTLQRSLNVDLTYDIIKLNHDGMLISRVQALSILLQHWETFAKNVDTILPEQELPLARIPKLRVELLLAMIIVVAGIADCDGIRGDAEITASGLFAFSDLCMRNRTMLEDLLGQPIRKDVQTNPIRQLNTFLKLGGLKLEPLLRQKRQKKSIRRYGFQQQRFNLMLSLASAFRSPDSIKSDLQEMHEMLAEQVGAPVPSPGELALSS